LGKPTQLTSFVTSLEELFLHTDFAKDEIVEQYRFLKAYWEAIRALFPYAFGPRYRRYIILKAIGVYSLNMLAADLYRWCAAKRIKPTSENTLEFLRHLKSFDWDVIRSFGGFKGVKEAHRLLLKHLAKNGVTEAIQSLRETPT